MRTSEKNEHVRYSYNNMRNNNNNNNSDRPLTSCYTDGGKTGNLKFGNRASCTRVQNTVRKQFYGLEITKGLHNVQ